MYLSAGYRMKSTKQLKYALCNSVVSLKHAHKTWVSEYGLNNQQNIESHVHMIIVTGGVWACSNFYEGRKSRTGHESRGPGAG